MGEILYRTRLSEQMFEGLSPWLTWLPGKLMHVNVFACGIFGTVSGSSAATCATIAKVALPELKRRGYDEKMCLGSLCGSGTLGILLPPSIIMVVYAVAAEVSILKVFLAGFLPGALLMLLFCGYIVAWALANPGKTPRETEHVSFGEALYRSRHLIPCLALIVFIVWVMVEGYATATEAAAYGVVGSLPIAWSSGGLNRITFAQSLMGATRLSCMVMFILAGASFLSSCMAFTGVPRALAEWVSALGPHPYLLMAVLALIYIVLGTALDGVSMIVLTMSVVLPVVEKAGFDLVWFGIFIVLLVEIAELTPPLGVNLFVLQTMSGRDSNYVAYASVPFFCLMVLAIVLITAFPGIATWLPETDSEVRRNLMRIAPLFGWLFVVLFALPAHGQSYPAKPVRIVVPFPAGGGLDFTTRVLAQKLSDAWGQQVVVENRPGASGMIGAESVVRSPKDGYTLLPCSPAEVSLNAALYPKMSYDPMRDLAPISLTAIYANLIAVHASVPARTWKELVALSKQTAGGIGFASSGTGSTQHLTGEWLTRNAGIRLLHVPYKGAAPATADLLGGQIPMGILGAAPLMPHIKAGRLRGSP